MYNRHSLAHSADDTPPAGPAKGRRHAGRRVPFAGARLRATRLAGLAVLAGLVALAGCTGPHPIPPDFENPGAARGGSFDNEGDGAAGDFGNGAAGQLGTGGVSGGSGGTGGTGGTVGQGPPPFTSDAGVGGAPTDAGTPGQSDERDGPDDAGVSPDGDGGGADPTCTPLRRLIGALLDAGCSP